jgi:hypothetical protein
MGARKVLSTVRPEHVEGLDTSEKGFDGFSPNGNK